MTTKRVSDEDLDMLLACIAPTRTRESVIAVIAELLALRRVAEAAALVREAPDSFSRYSDMCDALSKAGL